MSEQVIKTVENVDKLFSQIIVNGETFVSDKVVEQPKPVVKPSTKTETTTTASTTPKASRTGEDVYAVDLNDVLHNFTDRTTKQNLTEEIRNRTEKDTVMQTELNTVKSSLNTVKASVEDIQALIPNQATKDNQLADKDFVNSSISTNTANFLGTFNTLEEIEALTDVTNNDYAFWKTTDTLGSVVFKRYKYIADEQLWKFEYDLNNSSFTAVQWEAINSGITAELVAKIGDGSALVPSITQEQYNNLTEAEKNNGQIREITDTNPKKVMLNGMDLNEQLGNEPIGAVIPFGGSVIPRGYLLCNGQAVSRVDYTELFAVIGTAFGAGDGTTTFNVPDLREILPVGVGENTNLTIAVHDVYELGQFKDDQIQGHSHDLEWSDGLPNYSKGGLYSGGGSYNSNTSDPTTLTIKGVATDGVNGDPRTGTTTHGKQLGVNYVIKAKHVAMPADFVDAVNKVNSYSTEEKVIGEWIDGKPIYRKVLDVRNNGLGVTSFSINVSDLNIDYLIDSNALGSSYNKYGGNKWVLSCVTESGRYLYLEGATQNLRGSSNEYIHFAILEYTKTTD